MSRRDTIIIAVLINAGLLAILFVMAIHTDDEKVGERSEIEIAVVADPVPQQPNTMVTSNNNVHPIDEIDNVLGNLGVNEPLQPIVMEDQPTQKSSKTTVSENAVVNVAPPPLKTEDVSHVDVTVKRGDTLEKIAKANGTTVSAIKKANSLKSEKLKIGQILRIPVVSKKNSDKSSETAVPPSLTKVGDINAEYYTVKSGDNPWKIAKQFHVKFDDLLKLNNLDEEKARNMKVGDKIRIR